MDQTQSQEPVMQLRQAQLTHELTELSLQNVLGVQVDTI